MMATLLPPSSSVAAITAITTMASSMRSAVAGVFHIRTNVVWLVMSYIVVVRYHMWCVYYRMWLVKYHGRLVVDYGWFMHHHRRSADYHIWSVNDHIRSVYHNIWSMVHFGLLVEDNVGTVDGSDMLFLLSSFLIHAAF